MKNLTDIAKRREKIVAMIERASNANEKNAALNALEVHDKKHGTSADLEMNPVVLASMMFDLGRQQAEFWINLPQTSISKEEKYLLVKWQKEDRESLERAHMMLVDAIDAERTELYRQLRKAKADALKDARRFAEQARKDRARAAVKKHRERAQNPMGAFLLTVILEFVAVLTLLLVLIGWLAW